MAHQPTRAGDDAGFALLETVVSAVVLALVALAVFSGIEGAAGSAGREKARSVAASLAEQDQERMRAMSADELTSYAETRDVTVANVDYTVSSKTDWVRDDTGGTVSCTNNSPQVDYLRVQSEVRSAIVGKNVQPVVLASLVAPPVSSAKGTLGVQVNDRDDLGLAGKSVKITADGGGSWTETTNSVGCAIFSLVPVDAYTISIAEPGYVDTFGNNPATKGAQVVNGTVQVVNVTIDKAGSADWTVKSLNPATGAAIASSVSKPLNVSAATVSAVNGQEPDLYRTFTSSPAQSLFPFLTPYGFFTGSCAQSNPQTFVDPDYFSTSAGKVTVPRAGSASVQMYQPPLAIRVKDHYGNWATDATVRAILLDPTDDPGDSIPPCYEGYDLTVLDDGSGWVSKSDTTYDAGLPFGTYIVCAKTRASGRTRWTSATAATVDDKLLGGTSAGTTIQTSNSIRNNPDSTLCPS